MHIDRKTRPQVLLVNRCIVLNDKKQILLIQRAENTSWSPKLWEFPGGKLEANQDVSNTLEKEVFEETSLLLNTINRLAYYESFIVPNGKYAGLPYILIIGVGKVVGGDLRLSEEHIDYVWVDMNDINKYKVTAETTKALITLKSLIESI